MRALIFIALGLVVSGAALAQGLGIGIGVDDTRQGKPGPAAPIVLLTGSTNLLTLGSNLATK